MTLKLHRTRTITPEPGDLDIMEILDLQTGWDNFTYPDYLDDSDTHDYWDDGEELDFSDLPTLEDFLDLQDIGDTETIPPFFGQMGRTRTNQDTWG